MSQEEWDEQVRLQEEKWAQRAEQERAQEKARRTKDHQDRLELITSFIMKGDTPLSAIHRALDELPIRQNERPTDEEVADVFETAVNAFKKRRMTEKHKTEVPEGITEEEWEEGIEKHTARLKRARKHR